MQYQGSELDLFERATRWKSYYAARLKPHIGGDVLEVGAGLGGTTGYLTNPAVKTWTCLEPDPTLLRQIEAKIAAGTLPASCKAQLGSLAELPGELLFDTIVYIDVLEHIEDDAREVLRAAEHLRTGGKLIVLSPAHGWLYSPFDRAVGHHRRYTRDTLDRLRPPSLAKLESGYLDAVGMAASLANRVLLKSAQPNARQIELWDRAMVPSSRLIDPLLGFRVGKSVYAVWFRLP